MIASSVSGHRQTYDNIPEQIRKTRAALATDNLLVSDHPFTHFSFSQRGRFLLPLAYTHSGDPAFNGRVPEVRA
jgi:hypothetical protein